jgi:hypothetical protein
MQSFIPLHPDMFHTLIVGSKYEVIQTRMVRTNGNEVGQEPIYKSLTETYIVTIEQILPNHNVPQIHMKDNTGCAITIAGGWEQYTIRQL